MITPFYTVILPQSFLKFLFYNMQQARTHLESLLADGKLDETIDVYTQLSRQYHDPERTEKGILENSRYNDLMAQHLHGTISQADYQLERARLNRSVLNLIKELPANWKFPYEPLPENETPPPAASNTRPAPHAQPLPQKSFLERWGLILGILASLAGILGVTLKGFLFPKKEETTTTANPPQKDSSSTTEVAPTPTTSTDPAASQSKPTANPTRPTQQRPALPSQRPAPSGSKNAEPDRSEPVHTSLPPSTLATPDRKFRSYAKPQVSEDMEKGFILEGNKVAYRNLRTKAILCCFEDGEMFENGKAKVSENGKDYYYIDKNGKKTQ